MRVVRKNVVAVRTLQNLILVPGSISLPQTVKPRQHFLREGQSLPNEEVRARAAFQAVCPVAGLIQAVDRGRVQSRIVLDEKRQDLAQKQIKRLYSPVKVN